MKEASAGNQHFLFFPLCSLPLRNTNSYFCVPFILSSSNALSLYQSKILSLGKGLMAFILILVTDLYKDYPLLI